MVGNKNRIAKYALISTSAVAAVVIIMFSIPMLLPVPNQHEQSSDQQDSGDIGEAGAEEVNDQPPSQPTQNVSAVEEIDCEFVNDGVVSILGVDMKDDPQPRFASELLVGEFCNRPELVREMGSFQDPSLGLVAYACDASLGRIGDEILQGSLIVYSQIYCDSAKEAIIYEADLDLEGIESFRKQVIPEAEQQGPPEDSQSIIANILDEIVDDINIARNMAESGIDYYESVKILENGASRFSALVEQIVGEG